MKLQKAYETIARFRFLIAAAVLLVSISVLALRSRRDPMTPEDRAFWDANALKVREGWDKGFASGKSLGQRRAAEGKFSMSTRALSAIAESSRTAAGIQDDVIGGSYKRGFVFGFYKGLEHLTSPETSDDSDR